MDNKQSKFIWDAPVDKKELEKLMHLKISISSSAQKHVSLLHYCSYETLSCILKYKTIRCTALNSTTLNDMFECKRNDIEKFSGSRFISCFSHCQHEIVPFWYNYGGTAKTQKVALRFDLTNRSLLDYVKTDYCITPSNRKCFFYSDEYHDTINHNGFRANFGHLKPINTDYDLFTCVKTLKLFDMEYLPISNEIFTKNNMYKSTLVTQSGNIITTDIPTYTPSNLGKHKTQHWSYEEETRLMCIMDMDNFNRYKYIDLRINPLLFNNLEIIMNPWAYNTFNSKIQDLIESIDISEDIKNSIHIVPSELYHQIR